MAQQQLNLATSVNHILKECVWIANKAKYPIMSTVDENHFPQSRPIAVFQSTNSNRLKHVDFICFNSSAYARKIQHISKNNHVSFSFLVKDKRIYATLNGKATRLSAKEKVKYWYEKSDRLWYPNGPNSEHYSVWKVDIDSLSIYSPKLKYLFGSQHDSAFAQDTITSTPVVMERDANKQWIITSPKQK